jgi:hypothetical protein
VVRLPQRERAAARPDEELAIVIQVLDSIALIRKEGIILFNRPGLTL